MCRWLAYCGSPIYLESLIFKPDNSLISQSRQALKSVSVTNGDGFGIGWYGDKAEPGVFRDIQPAWNDENLKSISAHIRSSLFFAHVRASTGGSVSRSNCHPFNHENWMFMHNGRIDGFDRVSRELTFMVAGDLYPFIRGSTDSEILFYLMLSNGLRDDPPGALARTVSQVLDVMDSDGAGAVFTLTAAISDGETVHAVRYANIGEPPSLFYGRGFGRDSRPRPAGAGECDDAANSILILSEPLDDIEDQWKAVPESHVLIAGDGAVSVRPFVVPGRKAEPATAVSA